MTKISKKNITKNNIMNIFILLPYKENFVCNYAGAVAVSLSFNEITKESIHKKIQKFMVFSQKLSIIKIKIDSFGINKFNT